MNQWLKFENRGVGWVEGFDGLGLVVGFDCSWGIDGWVVGSFGFGWGWMVDLGFGSGGLVKRHGRSRTLLLKMVSVRDGRCFDDTRVCRL